MASSEAPDVRSSNTLLTYMAYSFACRPSRKLQKALLSRYGRKESSVVGSGISSPAMMLALRSNASRKCF